MGNLDGKKTTWGTNGNREERTCSAYYVDGISDFVGAGEFVFGVKTSNLALECLNWGSNYNFEV